MEREDPETLKAKRMGRKRPLRSVRCTVAAFKFTGSPTRTKMPVHCGRGHCAAQENDRRCHNDEWTRLMSHDLIQFRGRQTEFQALPESCRWNAVSVLFVPRRRKRRQCRKNTDLAANRIISARRCRAAPPKIGNPGRCSCYPSRRNTRSRKCSSFLQTGLRPCHVSDNSVIWN